MVRVFSHVASSSDTYEGPLSLKRTHRHPATPILDASGLPMLVDQPH